MRSIVVEKFEDRYVWGIEQSGGQKSANRIIQKRGKIIQNDDFTVLKETYPEHPLTTVPRRHLNRDDLIKKRKQ